MISGTASVEVKHRDPHCHKILIKLNNKYRIEPGKFMRISVRPAKNTPKKNVLIKMQENCKTKSPLVKIMMI
jgi:hypothetical protein